MVPATVLGGVYTAVVAPGPEALDQLVPLALVSHWYPIVPVPPVTVTLIVDVPPIHSVTGVGCTVTIRSGSISAYATSLTACPQPLFPALIKTR